MIQTKTNTSKSLAAESEQTIQFLTKISDLLKQQRRHFDDAVVISGCAITQPASGATDGAILWTMTDAVSAPIGLQPLASGSVSFCVKVQQ
jgi:hypothetical protein